MPKKPTRKSSNRISDTLLIIVGIPLLLLALLIPNELVTLFSGDWRGPKKRDLLMLFIGLPIGIVCMLAIVMGAFWVYEKMYQYL